MIFICDRLSRFVSLKLLLRLLSKFSKYLKGSRVLSLVEILLQAKKAGKAKKNNKNLFHERIKLKIQAILTTTENLNKGINDKILLLRKEKIIYLKR